MYTWRFFENKKRNLRLGMQRMNGSPVNTGGQLQIGLWFNTWQRAEIPHVPRQGLLHFMLMQASFSAQSVFTIHSGRQAGGLPINPGIHVHIAWLLKLWHRLFGPQGDGLHGFSMTIGSARALFFAMIWNFTKKLRANVYLQHTHKNVWLLMTDLPWTIG